MRKVEMIYKKFKRITKRIARYCKVKFYVSTNRMPLFNKLFVELQSNCNRSCFFCPRQGDDSGKRMTQDGGKIVHSMPTSHVLRILDEAVSLGFRGLVNFHHLSEPFLDPRIIDIAWEAKKRGLHPYTNTNGDILRRDNKLCSKAAEVFEYIKVGLYDFKLPVEIDEEKNFWQKRLCDTRVIFSMAAQKPHQRIFSTGIDIEKKTFPNGTCFRPLERVIIHYDGNVALCCEDMKDEFDLGNAFEMNIKDIWFSRKHIQIIKDLIRGRREKYSLCAKCPVFPNKSEHS